MYEILKDNRFTASERLLYNIMIQNNEIIRLLSRKKLIECSSCGGTHENRGQQLACAKKKKKEGVT